METDYTINQHPCSHCNIKFDKFHYFVILITRFEDLTNDIGNYTDLKRYSDCVMLDEKRGVGEKGILKREVKPGKG